MEGLAATEDSRGFWEKTVWGEHNAGAFVPGRWQAWEDEQPDWVEEQWLKTYRMQKDDFLALYRRCVGLVYAI